MKRMVKNLLSVTLLVSSAAFAVDATTAVTPYFSIRSQSENAARELAGWTNHVNKAGMDKHYGSLAFTPEYTRSLYGNDIAHTLFGCYYLQDCNKLEILGSGLITDQTPKALRAEWFSLSSTYSGSVSFKPVIQNFVGDVNFYWGMAKWAEGLYFRIHAPITWTKWDLGAVFKTTDTGVTVAGVTSLENAETFFCQKGVELSNTYTVLPLNCARFCGCSCGDDHSTTRLADIQADFGWNFLTDENYHLGLFVRGVAPTGSKVKGEWLFEPIVGNGRHWELGGGLTSSAIMWRNKEENKHLGLYIDANVTHLFNAKQNRVFDLKNKPLSRYILAFNPTTLEYSPLANLTSCEMKVNVAVQADVVGMLNYTSGNWSYDLGYNFWAKTCEKFDCKSCNDCCEDSCNDCCEDSCGCCGACIIKNGNTPHWRLDHSDATINTLGVSGTSLVLTDTDIDYDGARTKGLSNKVFGHIAYNWMEHAFTPYVGLGAEVEFGRNDSCEHCFKQCCPDVSCNDCSTSCDTSCDSCNCCTTVALSQWGLWLKGGFTF